ncbi:MAG: menaquinone biosynthesis protein [Bacteroidales bacterium]|jgi:chorismate dehydratase|nr:menaquinone biosynthesis protein [Bacteroidales bacterium]
MHKIKISAVSYTNTYPFIFGIENNDIIHAIDLSKDIPSVCAQKLIGNKVDIGLVPVAILPELSYHEIIADYCIGATNKVRSVILGAFQPLEKIKKIYLDFHSRSSVMLSRVLARNFWKINVEWAKTTEGFIERIHSDEAAVIIGDKALEAETRFPYVYDLAEEWIKFTQLPFVFAAWVANKPIDSAFKKAFNLALQYGLNHLDDMLKAYDVSYLPKHIDAKTYLEKNIDFPLDEQKRKGMKLFLQLAKDFQ